MNGWQDGIDDLTLALDTLLTQPRSVWSEAELLRSLQTQLGFFPQGVFSDNLLLFQAHFILYHCLYQLQQQYLQQKSLLLEISLAKVHISPWHSGHSGLIPADPLREYYLDLANLEQTSRDDVNELIDQFWLKMARCGAAVAPERIEQAFRELGVSPDATWEQVRKAYRQQLHRYHPDKGQDGDKTRRIIKAYNVIKLTR